MGESDYKANLIALLKNDKELLETANVMMKHSDENNDGLLQYSEVKALIRGICDDNELPDDQYPSEEELQKTFNELDKDNSGTVEVEELIPIVKDIFQKVIDSL